MVDKKISELTDATDLISSEMAGIQGGVTKAFPVSLFDARFYTKTAADAINTSTVSDLAARTRVRTCTTANITIATALNNADTLNGVVLATGELVLVKNQSAPAENGIYVVGVSPARSTQFDTYNEHSGSIISVQEGTTGADTLWICTSNTGGTLNTTAIVFAEFGGDAWVTTIKILDANVTNAKLANMADGLLKGRAAGAGTGVPTDLTVDQIWAILGHALTAASGRLTLETGVSVSTTDQLVKTTLYFTPHKGNQIGLYVSGAWLIRTFAEASISLAGLTTAKPYDVWGYDNAGTLALELLVWTNDTTRATALVLQDGVLVKSGDATRRYLGTIYTSATGQCEDSEVKRYVWNMNNRAARSMQKLIATDNWAYTTATVRQAGGDATNRFDFIRGLNEDAVLANGYQSAANSSVGVYIAGGISLDSTSTFTGLTGNASTYVVNYRIGLYSSFHGLPGLGRHFLSLNEYSVATGATTWYGDEGISPVRTQTGMMGTVFA